jgi:hypothetical protein
MKKLKNQASKKFENNVTKSSKVKFNNKITREFETLLGILVKDLKIHGSSFLQN